MEARQITVNDRGAVRVQLLGMYEEVHLANDEARGQALVAADGDVEFLYSILETPPLGFDWCRDYIFSKANRAVPRTRSLLRPLPAR